ncbi:MAG: hypothetical protein HY858_17000 [Candidatus Solibacter usitatus]|nr:hypothetical protein [Candidatus Solibacter usitatus]
MMLDDSLKPVAPEDPVLKASRDLARQTGLDKLTIDENDAEIAVYRREKRAKVNNGDDRGSCLNQARPSRRY